MRRTRSMTEAPPCSSPVTLFCCLPPLATAAQLRNRRLKQHEVAACLARVQPDDRTTLGSECETFRLAIQIAEPPRIEERRGAAPRREIIEPRYRGGLVTEQIEAAIRTYLEITEVSAGFGQCLVGKPDCESNEAVAAFSNRPPLAVRQCAAADQAPRPRMWRAKLNERRRLLLLGDEQMPAGQEHHSFAPRPLRVGPRLRNLAAPFHHKIDQGNRL